ncbi:post-transcriptional regulator [Salipaludibacillus agaradhaerens]|jgi:hypothetical protein|uniref:post-transcriptional regulator n=1 Tax=Salipaludibacillus agaradhaerens TaxID=76935 RepID=UPI00099762FA|nr:post-transcriptional regulator [Salipaludibacillus agaradhaerens]
MVNEQWSYWKMKLEPVIQSKVEEWKMLGYEKISEKDVWECFMIKVEKSKERPEKIRSHWMVSELFSLKVNDYMNLVTVAAYKGPEWFHNEQPVDFRLNQFEDDSS